MAVTFYFARHGETQFNVANRVQGWCDSPLTSSGIYDAYRLGRGLADIEFVGACTSDALRAQDTLSIALEARENERRCLRAAAERGDGQVIADEAAELFDLDGLPHDEQVRAVEDFLRSRGCLRPETAFVDHPEAPAVDARLLVRAERWRPPFDELDWVDYPAFALGSENFRMQVSSAMPVRSDTRLREWCFGDLEGEPARRLRNRMFDLFGDDLPREEQNERLNEIADHICATDFTHRAENFAAISGRIASFLDDCGRSVERHGGGNVLVVSHALLIRSIVFLYARERVSNPPKIANSSLTKVVWDGGVVSVGPVGATDHLERPERPGFASGVSEEGSRAEA